MRSETKNVRANDADEYIPKEKRDEAKLGDWQKEIAKVSQSVADDVLKHLSQPQGTPCTVMDIGSNEGTFMDQILQARPDCKMFAFEPVEDLFSYNYDRHKETPNVVLENLALSDSRGNATIHRSISGNLGWNTMEAKGGADMKAEVIQTVTMDEYAESHGLMGGHISALKIDVEGAEWRVFRGMHKFLESLPKKPIIAVEIGFGTSHPERKSEVAEFEWLFENGYKRIDYNVPGTKDFMFLPVA